MRHLDKARSMKLASMLILSVLLVVSLAFAIYSALRLAGVSMTVHGWIAMGLGGFLTLSLGAGLMALVFLSARNGFDDQQSIASDNDVT